VKEAMRISGYSEKEGRICTGQDRRLRLNFESLSCGGGGGSSGRDDDDDGDYDYDDVVLGLQ
jgi:hypothetical protein